MKQSKVRFRPTNQTKELSGLYLDFANRNFPGKRFKYGAGVEVLMKFWNAEEMRVRQVGSYSGKAKLINQTLNTLEATLLNYMAEAKTPNKEDLILKLDQVQGKRTTEQMERLPFLQWCESILDKNRNGVKASTISSKKQTIEKLKEFKKSSSGRKYNIDFETFDVKLYDKFVYWMKEVETEDKNKFSDNTVWKHTKEIKAFLRYAENVEGIEVCPDYRRGLFKVAQVESQQIYLSEDQIKAIADLDLSKLAEGYSIARDLFLVGCYSGLRYSDIVSLTSEHFMTIDKVPFIKKEQIKTSKYAIIPIRKALQAVFDKYEGNPPPPLAEPLVNRHLKVIADKAEIKEWDQVSTHTARRSFATNAYKAKVPLLQIMAITGHNTERSFLRYIRVTAEEHAMMTSLNPYFLD